ncbi:MAG: cytochrome c1 [Rhodospirillales bacterium]|nr:MAG: cytochrome c1 [Rhodospirillales bacterium]
MFTRITTIAAAAVTAISVATTAFAAEAPRPPAQDWGFSGLFGTFDRGAQQRGFQVFQQACQSCHALEFIHFRNLTGIGLSPEEVEAIAAEYQVEDGPDDFGDMFMRPARAADRVPPPFPNEAAARAANNGAYPPELSLMTRARFHGHDYLYALLTGYRDEPPEGVELMPGMYFNEWFGGQQIAMPPPLFDGAITYEDGTPETVEQYARDLVTFLAWTAEPELEERNRLGVKVVLFVIVLTGLLFALKKKIWSDVH